MIEVLALAGAVTKIAGGISSAVKAGKDLNSLMPSFGKLAKLDQNTNRFYGKLTKAQRVEYDQLKQPPMKFQKTTDSRSSSRSPVK